MVGTTDMLVHDVIVHYPSLQCTRHNALVPHYTHAHSLDMADGGRDGHSLWRTLRYHYLFKVYMPVYRMFGCQAGTGVLQDGVGVASGQPGCRILTEEEYMKLKSETVTAGSLPAENGRKTVDGYLQGENGREFQRENGNCGGKMDSMVGGDTRQLKAVGHHTSHVPNGLRGDRQSVYRYAKGRSYRQRKLRSFEKARLSCHLTVPIPEEPEYEQSESDNEHVGGAVEYSMENSVALKRRSLENDHWDKVVTKRIGLFNNDSSKGDDFLRKDIQLSKSCPSLQRILNSDQRKRSNSSPLRSGFLLERNFPTHKSSKYSDEKEKVECLYVCSPGTELKSLQSESGNPLCGGGEIPQSVTSLGQGQTCLCEEIAKRKQTPRYELLSSSPIGDINHNYGAHMISGSQYCLDCDTQKNSQNAYCNTQTTQTPQKTVCRPRLITQNGPGYDPSEYDFPSIVTTAASDIAQSTVTSQCKNKTASMTSQCSKDKMLFVTSETPFCDDDAAIKTDTETTAEFGKGTTKKRAGGEGKMGCLNMPDGFGETNVSASDINVIHQSCQTKHDLTSHCGGICASIGGGDRSRKITYASSDAPSNSLRKIAYAAAPATVAAPNACVVNQPYTDPIIPAMHYGKNVMTQKPKTLRPTGHNGSGLSPLMTSSCIELTDTPDMSNVTKRSRPKSEHYEVPVATSMSNKTSFFDVAETLAMKSRYLETNPLLNVKRCRSETNLKAEVIRTKLEPPSESLVTSDESDSDNESDDLIQRYRKRKIRNHRKLDILLGFRTGCCLGGNMDRLSDKKNSDSRSKDLYTHKKPSGCHLLGCKLCRSRYRSSHSVVSINKSDSDHIIYNPLPSNTNYDSSMPNYAHSLQDIQSNASLASDNQPVKLRRKTSQSQHTKAQPMKRYSCPVPATSYDVTSGMGDNGGMENVNKNNKPSHMLSSRSCMCFQSQKNDRQEILRKLAMAPEEEPMVFDADKALKKSNMQTRFQHGHGLQVCFMNEQMVPAAAAAKQQQQIQHAPQSELTASGSNDTVKSTAPEASEKTKEETEADLKTRQEQLQHEATIALAQVRPMAHMQLMVEKEQKQKQKKSPLAEIVGIPGLGDDKILELSHDMLRVMNVAQLQVVLNDLHSQIESLNIELMNQLVERDDLHMEQDSMLVDIEDLHRRAEELSLKVSSIPKSPKRRRDKKK